MANVKGKKPVLAVVIAVAALIVALQCFTVVPVNNTGVVKTLGKISGKVLDDGLRFKIPFVQSVEMVNNQLLKLEEDANAVSKDLQAVTSRIAVNYSIKVSASIELVRNIGAQLYLDTVLRPAVQESIKSVTAKYTAEGLITERAKVGAEIAKGLEEKVTKHGIEIEGFNIVDFKFSDAFDKAIEEKQVAQQELIRVRTEQEQQVVKAEAAAKAAEANARAILVQAEAQAEANAKLAASLTSVLVEYEKIQKWDGKLPQVSGGSPIVDIRNP